MRSRNSRRGPLTSTRDGLVIGEGACTLVLEELEHCPRPRGDDLRRTRRLCDQLRRHPHHAAQQRHHAHLHGGGAQDGGLAASDIGYVSAHGTATSRGDCAESLATAALFGNKTPVSSLKSFFGHTLGACGSIEAWLAVEMMREGWFSPTINLTDIDPECGELDYITGEERRIETEFVQSNNFAFGGINTSLIFKRV